MKLLGKIENVISIILFLAGITISLYAVFMRYVMNSSQSWATEFFTMMLVWAIFIGFSTALRDDKHITIDILYDRFNPAMKKISEFITLIIGIAFSIFFIWTGIEMVITAYQQEITTLDAEFPIWINYLIMPIGGTLLFTRFVEKAFRFFVKKEDIHKEGNTEWQQ
ncbi:C4-dicarboxylate transporter, DctQ subunit [Lentibacillus halodurans]|uniref:C4-dicarboxylate transporter, DctQ subunit n=1 Tax=Lentibacillus halodurans TaxID=237679 RepID=A0A1I0XN86_9BACI|nr:TRAP transporter small permease [Lentibacillus halodurans]SFB02515.1 C4-dicarboxylate transporter, DctQ subunit [Lentibacillus halodurans]